VKSRLGLLAVVLAVATVAACGGGGAQTTTPTQNNQMAPAAGAATTAGAADPAMASDDPMASGDAMASGDGTDNGNMNGGMAAGANEMGDEEKLPVGMTGAKAIAAGMGKDGNPVVSVTATETTCKVNKKSVPAGTVWFKLTNKGMKFNELYLEDAKGNELIQAANVKAGQVGAFKWSVKAGKMQLACELEDKGKQIRVPITIAAGMM
jgi:hypothetical protein